MGENSYLFSAQVGLSFDRKTVEALKAAYEAGYTDAENVSAEDFEHFLGSLFLKEKGIA